MGQRRPSGPPSAGSVTWSGAGGRPVARRALSHGPARPSQTPSRPLPQTQSRQSIFFLSASWLGCFTRKHDRQTNSSGCLGRTRSVTPRPVLDVGQLVVLGLVLDDEALLQDHVQAGLDVLVVGLLLLFLVRLLGAPLGGGGDGLDDGHSTPSPVVVLVQLDLASARRPASSSATASSSISRASSSRSRDPRELQRRRDRLPWPPSGWGLPREHRRSPGNVEHP